MKRCNDCGIELDTESLELLCEQRHKLPPDHWLVCMLPSRCFRDIAILMDLHACKESVKFLDEIQNLKFELEMREGQIEGMKIRIEELEKKVNTQ